MTADSWLSCYAIQKLLKQVNYHSWIITVVVRVLRDGQELGIEFGSETPAIVTAATQQEAHLSGHEFWDGHAVLRIPGIPAIFDPTIGFQGGYTTVDQQRQPLLIRSPKLAEIPPPGSSLVAHRGDVTFIYEVVENGCGTVERHPHWKA